MERIHTLIDKLAQQKAQMASPSQLLFTVQLLQHELLQLQQTSEPRGSRKVAVTLPFSTVIAAPETIFSSPVIEVAEPVAEKEISNSAAAVVVAPVAPAVMPEIQPVEEKEIYVLDIGEETEEETAAPFLLAEAPGANEYAVRKPLIQETLFEEPKPVVKEEPRHAYVAQQLFNSAFETTVEVPTLSQYKPATEVHESLAEKRESLNDRLKQEKKEVVHLLKETPIKDLRKGIGLNDRFSFVRELFRGDEAAYERSIKTINGFGIYSEAEYWISRELKFKLGWNDSNETVQHFYQLVRRRFS